MQVLQITDPHLYGHDGGCLRGVDTDSSLRTVLDDALAKGEDYAAVLVTGDLVHDDPQGYVRFNRIVGGLRRPVLCIPGNHDIPDTMRHSLAGAPFQYCGARLVRGWQFVMLDSHDPGRVGGRLSARELARLDAALASSSCHALVCLHHHPVDVGSRWLEEIGLANAADFWRVIEAHAHVRAVAWGHVHQAFDGERRGVRLLGTPSTCAQFLPRSDRYALDSSPPAYRRLDLHDDGRLQSEIRWVESRVQRQAAAR
jgi:Icc protein